MSFKVISTVEIPESERVTTDRPDYTIEQSAINVDIDVQAARVESSIIAQSTEDITTSGYDSDWTKTGAFAFTRGGVFSSASGTIYLEQSDDNETLVVQTTQAYTGGTYTGGFRENIVLPYFRIRFIPTTAGGSFRVWVRLSME